jgi:segregation and condensation protein B
VSAPDLKRVVEAVLFAADTPVPLDRLTEIVGDAARADVRAAVAALSSEYDEAGRPFAVAEVAGGWQLYCRPEYLKWVRDLHRGRMPTRLSQAALETLAIVAYKQPIVRAEIEIIRGVDSSGVLATLLRRNLITIAGRASGMGRALMYQTTKEFLRYFGLNAITDLPRLEEFAEVLGLRPDELELAIEGAESLAGVSSDRPGDDADGSDGDLADGGAERERDDSREEDRDAAGGRVDAAPDDDGGPWRHDEDEDEDAREDAGAERTDDERAAIFVPRPAADRTADDAPPILPGPDSGVHPTPDRKIIDSTDET